MFASPGGVLSFGRDPDGDWMGDSQGNNCWVDSGLIMVDDGRL